jgi:pilus assembly protein Flp/PilA
MLMFLAHLRNMADRQLRHDDRGVTAVEYGLIIALVAIIIITGLTALSGALNGVFTSISGTL